MRRLRDRQPGGLFRGGELPRLMTMIVMLCVLGMMIRRAADHDTWRFLTGEPANLKDGATEPGPPHKPRVRSRQAARRADGIVINAPESDAILSLQHPAKPPADAAPHDAPVDEPAAESIVAAAVDQPATATSSDEPAPQQSEPKSESAPVELALGPESESSAPTAAQATKEESPVAAPAAQAGTPSDSKSAPADPSTAASAPAQSQPAAQSKPAPESAEPEKSAVEIPENTAPEKSAPQNTATDSTPPQSSEPTVGPSPYSASQHGASESLHKPLFRPHLPANPDTILQPGTIPEKPEIEPALLDEDMEERRQFDHECEAISDRTPLGPEEMFAYWRLLRWSESQTADEMLKRARTDVRYNDLLQRPEEFRGELLRVRLHIRQVLQEDAPPDIPVAVHHYYQALGWNDASQSWFYFCIFTDLPEGMKLGDVVYEEGTFVGYFLKTHTYLDGKGTKTKAPILIGRMIYHPTPSIARNPNEWIWSWSIGGVLLLLFVLRWGWRFFGRRKSAPEIKGLLRRPGLSAESAGEDEPLDIADWLDQVEAGQSEKEIKPADIHDSNGSAHGNGLPLRRDRGLDWTEDSER